VNYAGTPTYLFTKGNISVRKKIKESGKRLYWGMKDKLRK
jgi:hypothetical protein